jgi:hypothetical protein
VKPCVARSNRNSTRRHHAFWPDGGGWLAEEKRTWPCVRSADTQSIESVHSVATMI